MKNMRNLLGRVFSPIGGYGDSRNGAAILKGPTGCALKILFSDGGGWDHVSISAHGRCPTWEEMCFVKDVFFAQEEECVQFHPPRSEYVNVHPHCLHLWRDQTNGHPRPPGWMIG